METDSIVFDNSKIKRFVPGFKATVPFAEGIKNTVQWFEAHPDYCGVDQDWNHLMDRIIEVYEASIETAKKELFLIKR